MENKKTSIPFSERLPDSLPEINKQSKEITELIKMVDDFEEVMIVMDMGFGIKGWNKGAREIFGFTQEEALGRDYSILLQVEVLDKELPQILCELRGKKNWKGEVSLESKSGDKFFVQLSLNSIKDSNGISIGICAFHKDQTEIMKLKEQLHKLGDQFEENIHEKKAEISRILERITDAFVALDENLIYTYVNNKAAEIFKCDRNSLLGKHIWGEFPEGLGPPFYYGCTKALKEQTYVYMEEYCAPYGRWFKNHIYPSPHGLSVFFKDITDQKIQQFKIEQSEEKYRQIIETAHEGVWLIDENNITTLVNTRIADMLGYSKEEMMGQPLFNFMDDEGREIARQNLERRRKGLSEQHEFVFKKKNNENLYTLLEGNPIIENGEYKGSLAMITDITERKKSEELLKISERKLALIYNTVCDSVFMIEEQEGQYKFISVNQAFLKITGLSKEEVEGQVVGNIIRESEANLFSRKIEEAKVLKKSIQWEGVCRFSTGSKIGLVNLTPIIDEDGGCKQLVGSVYDVTEIRKAERDRNLNAEKLEQQNKELTKTNTELDSFVYRASHDLRSPLVSILGLISLTRSEKNPQLLNSYYDLMEKSVHRLDGFITNIIEYSRNNRTEVTLSQIDFKSMIKGVLEGLKFMEGADEVEVEENIEASSPFYSDPLRLQVIFNNLISNSIKYRKLNSKGKIFIEISVNEKEATIDILDYGRGIPSHSLDRIFEMFYRATNTNAGSGLGLYIVKDVINNLKGSISVESEIDKGTKFHIDVPNCELESKEIVSMR